MGAVVASAAAEDALLVRSTSALRDSAVASGGTSAPQPCAEPSVAAVSVVARLPVWGIEGGIACGKTTASRAFESVLPALGAPVHIVYERMNPELLALFYAAPTDEAFAFQLHTQNNRLHHVADARRRARAGELVLMDRTTWGDSVFAAVNWRSGNISAAQMRVYESLAAHPPHDMAADAIGPDIILYLDVAPEEAHRRMTQLRKTACEAGVPLAYLNQLDAAYVRRVLLQLASGRPNVVVANWDNFGAPPCNDGSTCAIDCTPLVNVVSKQTDAWTNAYERAWALGGCRSIDASALPARRVRFCATPDWSVPVDARGATWHKTHVYASLDAVHEAYARRATAGAYAHDPHGTDYAAVALPWVDNALERDPAMRRVAMDHLALGRSLVFYGLSNAQLMETDAAVAALIARPLALA
jgi:deoxyadenosine/deoxycytidine kinase